MAMMDRRARVKGRKSHGRFGMIPKTILDSREYAELSAPAAKLLLDMAGKYSGANNGDLSMPWSDMRTRGWKSKDTLERARKELLRAGFIEVSRQGGRRICNLYALTFHAVDPCGGKLDVSPTEMPSHHWKNGLLAPADGSIKPGYRGNGEHGDTPIPLQRPGRRANTPTSLTRQAGCSERSTIGSANNSEVVGVL